MASENFWTEEDREIAENAIENSLEYFRCNELSQTSIHKRNHHRKVIKNELKFLSENFPTSYILTQDMSDISYELE